jgi:predicted transcriptional regulator of viral defense system
MSLNNKDASKTLGAKAARLVMTLNEKGRPVFRLKDVQEILRLSDQSARSFTRKLVDRGIASRIKPGLFILVPFELGREREYAGNPLVVARELVWPHPYFISHATAMDLHGMTTQPIFVIYVSTTMSRRDITASSVPYRFVRCKRREVFGISDHWVTKQERIRVSDLERTVIDGLRRPQYAGGISEVAKGLWLRRSDMDPSRLVRYAERLGVGAVFRRLGFLFELYSIGTSAHSRRIQRRLTSTYVRLDPILPAEGRYLHRWRLQLNVEPEELQSVLQT